MYAICNRIQWKTPLLPVYIARYSKSHLGSDVLYFCDIQKEQRENSLLVVGVEWAFVIWPGDPTNTYNILSTEKRVVGFKCYTDRRSEHRPFMNWRLPVVDESVPGDSGQEEIKEQVQNYCRWNIMGETPIMTAKPDRVLRELQATALRGECCENIRPRATLWGTHCQASVEVNWRGSERQSLKILMCLSL